MGKKNGRKTASRMKFPEEHCTVPSVVLKGQEIGEHLMNEIEAIQALYTLAGIKRSKSSVIIEMMQSGLPKLKDSVRRLAKEKGGI